ncbi:hypothetical protein [Streptomyces sp. NPDC101234]|uniref:hypothetical protein n=1 Tax=Streptomyces sp. NPDC101234 TaxID=3366138 RepID=UPI00381F4995
MQLLSRHDRPTADGEYDPGDERRGWCSLEYTGPEADPDQGPRTERLAESVADIRERQAAGALPKEMDPACLTVTLMAAAMAPVTLPHVIAGVCEDDAQSPEFIERFADQLALLVRRLGLDSDGPE